MNQHRISQKIRQILRLDLGVRFVWNAAPGWTLISLVLIIVQGVLPLLVLYVMKLIINAVTFALTVPHQTPAFHQVGLLIALAAGVAVLTILCRYHGFICPGSPVTCRHGPYL